MLDRVACHAEKLIDDLGTELIHLRKLVDIAQHVIEIAVLQALQRVALAFDVGYRRLGVRLLGRNKRAPDDETKVRPMLDHAVVAAAPGPVQINDVAGALAKLDHPQIMIMAAADIEVLSNRGFEIADPAGKAADRVGKLRNAVVILS